MNKIVKNRKGFTLAELLAVVAVIAVLVAIAIPVFSSSTDKAQAAVEQANARATYAEAVVEYITGDATKQASITENGHTETYDSIAYTAKPADDGTWTVTLATKVSSSGPASYTFGGTGSDVATN